MVLEFSITNTFSISERQTISFDSALNDPATDGQHCIDCNGKRILKMACIYGANASAHLPVENRMMRLIVFRLSLIRSFKISPVRLKLSCI